MKTNEFLSLLTEHQNKNLLFEYKKGRLVNANYHITEVKNITVNSVDCGAGTDFWKETLIQLWESPNEAEKTAYLSTYKALGILNKVDRLKPMERNAEIKFEYGNLDFHTAQLFVQGHEVQHENLIVKLGVEKTDCKAKETCGVPVEADAKAEGCCTHATGCC